MLTFPSVEGTVAPKMLLEKTVAT
ncbi:hypothetical protein Zm00014a_004333 [Zea mays]|uniref:Uncharacterized protein n=1 Tax=Zea mays TaxID=4577 RepID=A0A3L6FHL1_MAIZE|nr:hypothetical protein Zm00014a_004333 [Zea mays]